MVPTETGALKIIVLGFCDYEDYYKNNLCACQSIGRVAGRIGKASYTHNMVLYSLPKNEGENCLHGGPKGMQVQNWNYVTNLNDEYVETKFIRRLYSSVDGFPGDVTVSISYRLNNNNRLTILFEAFDVTESTVFNPTNHVYFNLSDKQDLSSHELQIYSDYRLELDSELIPTGQKINVDGTNYDFRKTTDLLPRIEANNGFDDAFVVGGETCDHVKEVAIYTMDIIEDNIYFARDKGKMAKGREAIAMEAQTLPDAVNHTDFGDIILEEGHSVSYEIGFQYFNSSKQSCFSKNLVKNH